MAKFNSSAEVREERNKISEQFDGGLPDYLQDYFDEQELKHVETEYFIEKKRAKYDIPYEEKVAYKAEKEKEFWENNEAAIVKCPLTVGGDYKPSYPTPARATERVEDEVELTQEEKLALVSLCEKDLYLFAVRYFPHYLKKPSSEFHRFLYQTLSREFNKTRKEGFKWAIAAPRSSAKSSIVSAILPLWCICYNKKRFIIIVSDTADQAKDFLADIKAELESNELLAQDFPYVCGKGSTWRQDTIITNNSIKVLALGSGNKMRGRRFGTYRPSLIIADDLENPEMVRSPAQRDFLRYDWFDKDVAFVGGEKGSNTDYIMIGTILGKDSLLNAVINDKAYSNWNSRVFSAVKEFSDSQLWDEWAKIYTNRFDINRAETAKKFFEEHSEEMLEGTKVLWPEGAPYYDLMTIKYTTPSAFVTEQMNSPVDTTKIYITKDQLHFEDFYLHTEIIKALKNGCDYYGFLDPSLGKKSNKGDYSCIATLARDRKTGYIYVVSINLKRRSVDKQIEAILKANDRFKYKMFGIETNAFQYVVKQSVEKLSRELGIYIPLKEVNQYHDKKMRFEGMLPFLTDGTIIFDSRRARQHLEYSLGIEQICSFTGDNDKHDDAPDAIEGAFSLCRARKFKLTARRTK